MAALSISSVADAEQALSAPLNNAEAIYRANLDMKGFHQEVERIAAAAQILQINFLDPHCGALALFQGAHKTDNRAKLRLRLTIRACPGEISAKVRYT